MHVDMGRSRVRDRQARVDLVRCRLTSQDHSWNWALLFRPFRGGWNFTWWYVRGSVHTEAVANKADKSQMDKTTLRCVDLWAQPPSGIRFQFSTGPI